MNEKKKAKDKRLKDFSAIIRKRRFEMGHLNAEILANKHKLNRSVYQRWENGEDMNLSSLLKLLEVLEMKGSELFEIWEEKNREMPPFKFHYAMVAEMNGEYEKKKK
jgi:ribosome-binding protein aMBF1 (putative translation factor)